MSVAVPPRPLVAREYWLHSPAAKYKMAQVEFAAGR